MYVLQGMQVVSMVTVGNVNVYHRQHEMLAVTWFDSVGYASSYRRQRK